MHPVPVSAPSTKDAVNPVEQLSLTVAVPNAAAISDEVGLQFTGVDAVTIIVGACVSLVNVMVCEVVAVLPQPSVAVQVLVTEWVQLVPVSAPSTNVAVNPIEQLSLTVAVPNAAAISDEVGLQLTGVDAVTVMVGACVSLVKLIVCEVVAVLLHASVAVQVLVTE